MKFVQHLLLFTACVLQLTAWGQPASPELDDVVITYEVKRLYGLNTSYSEFSPVAFGNKLYFTSEREYSLLNVGEGNWKKSAYLNIFETHVRPVNDSITFMRIKPLSNNFNTGNHSGPLSFKADGTEVFFNRTVRSPKSKGKKIIDKPKIYAAKIVEGKWVNEMKLSFCEGDFSYGHPSISGDGNVLYFASDMSGGKGGKDIWRVERSGDAWGQPVNVSGSINTTGDEMFPTIVGDVLYFASNGHPGKGGLDLFKVEMKEGEWGEPENMGDVINSPQDDFGITFNTNKKSGYFSSDRVDTNGKDDIYYFDVIETVVVRTKDLAGQFHYRTLKHDYASGLEVVLLDDDGNIVLKTTTDEEGNFIFRDLPIDSDYQVKLLSEDDVELTIFGKNGEPIGFLKSNSEGKFVYRQLEFDQVSTLTLIDETDMDLSLNTGRLSGQFVYEMLARDYPDGLPVYLVDDEGNIVFKTKTDKQGNFEFRDLPLDNSYIIKTKEEVKDYTVLIFNRNGDVVAELKGNAKGEFVYRKLGLDDTNAMALRDNPDSDVNLLSISNTVYGRFHYEELDQDFPGGLNILALDDDGNLLVKGQSDEKGYFRFTSLPLDDNFRFSLKDNDPDPELNGEMVLTIYDRTGKPIGKITKDGGAFFDFSKMKYFTEDINTVDVSDVDVLAQIRNKELPMIYFERNSSYLETLEAEKLRQIAQIMNDNPALTLEISSHTSARSSDEYNMDLSKRRTEGVISYLLRKGVSKTRLKGTWHGETMLVNKCKDGVECSDEEHGQNRRTEFKFK